MTLKTPVTLAGAPPSPYTRKMLSVLRYRHIPYRVIWKNPREMNDLPQPKVGLLPTFYLDNDADELEAVVDSTPLIARFDLEVADRQVRPADPVIRLIDDLLEDYGDEWLTKAMFHYRWYYEADIKQAGEDLPRARIKAPTEEQAKELATIFRDRQISRLYVVGSNDITAPVIEESYARIIEALRAHLVEHPFIMGNRPGAADFAFFGQLTQLAQFDPTPMAVTLEAAPRVYAWVLLMEDLSGEEPADDGWFTTNTIPATLRAILSEVGRVYTPFLLANAKALEAGADEVDTTIGGVRWVQKPFPYQGKCLMVLRERYNALSTEDRTAFDAIITGTGCEAIFA
ncbi:MAG: glutathione S-transferase C-terminal domain-containing protein [Candidatus Phaeomarinobacter sp.]